MAAEWGKFTKLKSKTSRSYKRVCQSRVAMEWLDDRVAGGKNECRVRRTIKWFLPCLNQTLTFH